MGFVFLLSSCTTSFQDRQIKDIPGEWEVFQATTQIAEFLENGANPIEPPIEESGDLGFFDFSKTTVKYAFVRNDSFLSGSGSYSIDRNRISQKIVFSIGEDFLLLPPDERPHRLIFNTSDQGVIMLLNFTPEELGPGEGYTLFLKKVK